jgi:hypothetical protein
LNGHKKHTRRLARVRLKQQDQTREET